jgi:ribonuclease-3
MIKLMTIQKIEELEKLLNYTFSEKRLLVNSLVHKSYLNEKTKDPEILKNNERLEFLGDAVLELIITEFLFLKYEDSEGFLTAVRAALVNYKNLASVARQIGLDTFVLMSKGEQNGSDEEGRLSIVADCIEAVIGAIYIDGGYEAAKKFIELNITPKTEEIVEKGLHRDPKTTLQEKIQKKHKITPKYKVLDSFGKDHEKTFVSGVFVGEKLLSKGKGRSKQESETNAAIELLKDFEESETA